MEEKIKDLKNFYLQTFSTDGYQRGGKNMIKKVYQKLFSRDLISDFIDATTWKDKIYENYLRIQHKLKEISR